MGGYKISEMLNWWTELRTCFGTGNSLCVTNWHDAPERWRPPSKLVWYQNLEPTLSCSSMKKNLHCLSSISAPPSQLSGAKALSLPVPSDSLSCADHMCSAENMQETVKLKMTKKKKKNEMLPGQTSCTSAQSAATLSVTVYSFPTVRHLQFCFLQAVTHSYSNTTAEARRAEGALTATVRRLAKPWHSLRPPEAICSEIDLLERQQTYCEAGLAQRRAFKNTSLYICTQWNVLFVLVHPLRCLSLKKRKKLNISQHQTD